MKEAHPKVKHDAPKEESKGQPIPVKIIPPDEEPVRVTDKRFWVQDESQQAGEAESYSFKPSYVEELEKKLSESQKKIEEVKTSYREFKQESTAEIQKARERLQNEFNRRTIQNKSELVSPFLNILENFDRALAAAGERHSFESLLEGVQLIRGQFISALAEHDVVELDLEGQIFNPELAEAVGVIEVKSEDMDHKILEVTSKGYRMGDMIIRPAKVKVGRLVVPASQATPS
ncbi:MAG: nucleotide exchange factor GrpE [Terriglobia bacterium]